MKALQDQAPVPHCLPFKAFLYDLAYIPSRKSKKVLTLKSIRFKNHKSVMR